MKKRDDKLPIVVKKFSLHGREGWFIQCLPPASRFKREKGGRVVRALVRHRSRRGGKSTWCEGAATVVAWSALSAHCEGDTCEYRFWLEVGEPKIEVAFILPIIMLVGR